MAYRIQDQKQVQKRRQMLQTQLYGKDSFTYKRPSDTKDTLTTTSDSTKAPHSSLLTDTSYLKKDLVKIFLFTSLALVAQASLYYGVKTGLVRF